jgi:hypothetical protein
MQWGVRPDWNVSRQEAFESGFAGLSERLDGLARMAGHGWAEALNRPPRHFLFDE